MDIEKRIENYHKETKYPASMFLGGDGRMYGFWEMGQNYRVKSNYYGGYPAGYLKRVKALFPDKHSVLHLFSGKVDTDIIPGDTVDINTENSPTFVDDAQSLLNVPLEKYDLVLADPPYSIEDCEHYGVSMVKRNKVMKALQRLSTGTHVVWLDQVKPMYKKAYFTNVGSIAMMKSTNHRFRVATIFERT